jgi:hypothetical protein
MKKNETSAPLAFLEVWKSTILKEPFSPEIKEKIR